jgi:hypothetical protein
MGEIVYYPTTCPCCERVTAVPYTRTELIAMLKLDALITLYSPCHNSWPASKAEIAALRQLVEGRTTSETKYPNGRQPAPWEHQIHSIIDPVDFAVHTFLPTRAAND